MNEEATTTKDVEPTPTTKKSGPRMPPSTPRYEFTFRVTRALDLVDATSRKSVTYYFYEVRVKRIDRGVQRTHVFPASELDAVRFKKRWSELDAFDHTWPLTIARREDGTNPLHDEIALDPYKVSKLTAPIMLRSAVRPRRSTRFTNYINACMSDARLHRVLARFLSVPIDVLSPDGEDPIDEPVGGVTVDEAPIMYTPRKVRRVVRNASDPDAPSRLTVPGSTPGVASATRSRPPSRAANQYMRDGTPNKLWSGPTADEWSRLERGLELLKLPHSALAKPKPRLFSLLPLYGGGSATAKAQSKVKEARRTRRASGAFDTLSPRGYVLTWDSTKSDVLDTFFLLGERAQPWRVVYGQTAGQFARAKKDSKGISVFSLHESRSCTILWKPRSDAPEKSLDLIAHDDDEFDLLRRALTYVEWLEQGMVVPPSPANLLSPSFHSRASSAIAASPSPSPTPTPTISVANTPTTSVLRR